MSTEFLNEFIVLAAIASGGSEFHKFTARKLKKFNLVELLLGALLFSNAPEFAALVLVRGLSP